MVVSRDPAQWRNKRHIDNCEGHYKNDEKPGHDEEFIFRVVVFIRNAYTTDLSREEHNCHLAKSAQPTALSTRTCLSCRLLAIRHQDNRTTCVAQETAAKTQPSQSVPTEKLLPARKTAIERATTIDCQQS